MNWAKESALDWDCCQRGCYNICGRPKLKALKDALPGNIGFSDVDAAVEVGGRVLTIEWKSLGASLPWPQQRYHEGLTAASHRIVSVVVEGDAASMTCNRMRVIRRGSLEEWEPCTLVSLKERIHRWSHTAQERARA